jgi:hypothetical protein
MATPRKRAIGAYEGGEPEQASVRPCHSLPATDLWSTLLPDDIQNVILSIVVIDWRCPPDGSGWRATYRFVCKAWNKRVCKLVHNEISRILSDDATFRRKLAERMGYWLRNEVWPSSLRGVHSIEMWDKEYYGVVFSGTDIKELTQHGQHSNIKLFFPGFTKSWRVLSADRRFVRRLYYGELVQILEEVFKTGCMEKVKFCLVSTPEPKPLGYTVLMGDHHLAEGEIGLEEMLKNAKTRAFFACMYFH